MHNHSRSTLNGTGYKAPSDEDTADDAALSPPPSSSASSVQPDMGDEIVVGTRAAAAAAGTNGEKPSPRRVASPKEDTKMTDPDDEPVVSHYPKRKRASVYDNLGEDKLEGGLLMAAEEANTHVRQPQPPPPPKARPGVTNTKGVLLGIWRDSPIDNDTGKHAVIGFPDVRDRLRTRIQNFTRNGDPINTRLFPVPPGPGGSWVTFERVIFDDHLVGLDHNQVKEYVKLRMRTTDEDETAEDKRRAEIAAVEDAKRYLEAHPPPETAQPPAIAYGKIIPDNAQHGYRPDAKRRRTGSATGAMSAPAAEPSRHSTPSHTPQPQPQTLPKHEAQMDHQAYHSPAQHHLPSQAQQQTIIQQQPPIQQAPPPTQGDQALLQPNLPGQRPTRILVGCWSRSSAANDADKHAVYGILGANDMFRVKLVRETMDGRFMDGNFPTGAGALWIAYEEVNFLPHIRDLNRGEMKEYCRIRQYQIDMGEKDKDRVDNETKAVYEAQRRAALNPKANNQPPVHTGRHNINAYDREDRTRSPKPDPAMVDMRHSRREVMQDPRAAQVDYRQNSRHGSVDALERTNNLARREVHKMEAAQMRQNHQQQQRGAMSSAPMPPAGPVPSDSRVMFQENINRLNKVWTAQEAHRLQGQQPVPQQQPPPPPPQQQQPQMVQMQPQQQQQPPPPQQQMANPVPNMDEVRTFQGCTYTRKPNGPFAGKLVSRGEIISIDGEDYVEYRVLTKPIFF